MWTEIIYFASFVPALLPPHPQHLTQYQAPVDVTNTCEKDSKVSLNLGLQISMDLPILEKAIIWALQGTLHLNHKLFLLT